MGFQFDRLRNQLAIELGQDGKMYAKKASNKLRQLLENLPVELRQDFLKHQFYFAQDDGIKEQMHYE